MNKNTIDAYHKITAPKGLRERIEANVLAEQEARSVRRNRWWKEIRVPAATVLAAAAVCLILWAGGAGMDRQDAENRRAGMRAGETPMIMVMSEDGSVLGSEETELRVYSGENGELNGQSARSFGLAAAQADPADESRDVTGQTETVADVNAVILRVSVTEPTTFRTDSDSLSVYLVDEMLFTEPCSELILTMDGELCVFLPAMGDGEVFSIEISSTGTGSTITIVYDETAGR